MAGVNVKSEIKPLKKVLLHRPGRELLNLTPNTLEELLFDDIPFLKVAQEEHDAFAQALRDNGVEVVYLERLMAEVLDQNPELREKFLKQFIEEAGIRTERYQKIIYDYLNDNYPDNFDLVLKTMEGINLTELHTDKSNSPRGPRLRGLQDGHRPHAEPLLHPRPVRDDRQRRVHQPPIRISIQPRDDLRRVHLHAPSRLQGRPQYYSRYSAFHIEGGDILNINEHVLAIGISQRTEPDAIDEIAHNIFNDETSPVDTILAFNIPNNRAMMHLDTVFTQIDVDKFTIHPGIMGPLTVFEITPEGAGIKVREMSGKLEDILEKYVGRPVELIPCGGGDRIAAEREQWNDGSNTLCIAPGTVVVYERNDVTNALLKEKGINVIEIPSAELSRGRGGPRCMSMPIWRED